MFNVMIFALLTGLMALTSASCESNWHTGSKDAPTQVVEKPDHTPNVEDGMGLLFTFPDQSGRLQTVSSLAAIDRAARASVIVTNPQHPAPKGSVYVVDLTKKDSGPHLSTLQKKSVWLDRVIPKITETKLYNTALVPSETATMEHTPKAVAKIPKRRRSRKKAGALSAQRRVVIYSTSWCPSCKAAKAFFKQVGVDYQEIDVEQSQAAAKALLSIQRRNGYKVGSVPLIMVGKRAYQGFSPLQMSGALQAAGIHVQ